MAASGTDCSLEVHDRSAELRSEEDKLRSRLPVKLAFNDSHQFALPTFLVSFSPYYYFKLYGLSISTIDRRRAQYAHE